MEGVRGGWEKGGGGREESLTIFIVYLQASLVAYDAVLASGLREERVSRAFSPHPLPRLYTTLLHTETPRVDVVIAMHRQRAGPQRAQTPIWYRVAGRIRDPRVLGVQHRRGRRIVEILEAPVVLRPLGRLVGRVTRLEDVRPSLDGLARYHVRIVVWRIRVHLLLEFVPVRLARHRRRRRRRRRRQAVLLALVMRRLMVRRRLRRLRSPVQRMTATVQGQRYPDDQNTNGSHTAGETRHQEAVIGHLVRDPATCGTKREM